MKIELVKETDPNYKDPFFAVFVDDVKITDWTHDEEEATRSYERVVNIGSKPVPKRETVKTIKL